MTFSLRDLLALFVLLALALLAWRTSQEARRERSQLAQLQDEIKSLEAQLRMDQPALHQAILNASDELEPLQTMQERFLAQFDMLRKKYGALEPREANVFSLRGVPSLQLEGEPYRVVFRLCVPQERPVWLKFGVHKAQQSYHSSRNFDDESDLLSRSPFAASGPFELRLPPGDQMLEIATGAAREGSLPLGISLNGADLLRSSFDLAEVSSAGTSYTSGDSQLDFGPDQKLPWLQTAIMDLGQGSVARRWMSLPPAETHAFSLWLSDRTSGFAGFPSTAEHPGTMP